MKKLFGFFGSKKKDLRHDLNLEDHKHQADEVVKQEIKFRDEKWVYSFPCIGCGKEREVELYLENGKIQPTNTIVEHQESGKDSCPTTRIDIQLNDIPGSTENNRIKINVCLGDETGSRHGSYTCLCGEEVQFHVDPHMPKLISHKHDKCGFVSELELYFERKHERQPDINDHIIVSFNDRYGLIGKIIDYSECGAKVKLLLEKQGYEQFMPYFEQDNEIRMIQYKGNIKLTDFPQPYKINQDDFGYTVLKLNGTLLGDSSENKIYRDAVVVLYGFNEEIQKTELRLKFLSRNF